MRNQIQFKTIIANSVILALLYTIIMVFINL